MTKHTKKAPLYRKVNTRARGVHHDFGGASSDERNTKAAREFDGARATMHGKHQRGLDYTPLFKFLLSKVGQRWDEIFSEAVARLDKKEPIFWLVARSDLERKEFVRIGEASYFSGLYVDGDGLLQKVNPRLEAEQLVPQCTCCTHTFNGVRFPVDPSASTPGV